VISRIKALFHPEQYHGWTKKKNYFEGWYFKLISKDEKYAFAIIPGIAMAENTSHAFIQVLDGKKRKSAYHKFKAESFLPKGGKFEINIAENFFSKTQLKVKLKDFEADLKFVEQVPWPSSVLSPNIMGPFSFIPFMECNHGILSMNHTIEGSIKHEGKDIDFSGGRGYMEKDWGRSFPSAYIWMQSNHFSESNISIKSSIAKIPWLGSSFVGFIAGVYLKDRIIQFTTYNLSRLKKAHVNDNEVNVILENPKHRLTIKAIRKESTELASPIMGFMDGRIEESMEAELHVKLVHKKSGEVLLDDIGRNAGLEIAGNIKEIVKNN